MRNVSGISADEELNEQVAVEVMGWRQDEDWGCLTPPEQKAKPSEMWTGWKVDPDELDDYGEAYVYREPVKGTTVSGTVYNGEFSKIYLPDYSGDIGEAWRVVEKMVDDYGCNFSVEKIGARYHAGDDWGYHARLTAGNLAYASPKLLLDVFDGSGPLAICRAALLAVRGQRG